MCVTAVLQSVGQHSPLKRSVSLTPPMSGSSTQPLGHGWLSQEDLRGRGAPLTPDHAPLSPQSSVASSGSGGSEHLEDSSGLGMAIRSSFSEEGSGMRGEGTLSVNGLSLCSFSLFIWNKRDVRGVFSLSFIKSYSRRACFLKIIKLHHYMLI